MGVAQIKLADRRLGIVQCQSVCGVMLVASVHIMSVSRQGVAKMSNREIYGLTIYTWIYNVYDPRPHRPAPRASCHDDASALHNLMALGPVAPAQRAHERAARRDRAVWWSFD